MNLSPDDKNKVLSLLEHAYASRVSDLKLSDALASEALAISRRLDDKELIARSLSHLSLFHMIMGDYASSTRMAEDALLYFKELGDEKGMADAKYNLAGIYYKTDNFHLGLIYLVDCLVIYRKYNDYHNQARVQKSLGTIYEYFGDQNNAIKAYESSIEAAQKIGDVGLESNAYNPLSGIYLKHNKVKKALSIIERAIRMKEESGDTRGLAFSLYGRAKVYTRLRRFEEAENDFKAALSIHLKVGERLGTGMAYRKMGAMYIEMGHFKKAKATLRKALQVSDEYNIAMVRYKSHYHLYQLYKYEQNIARSLRHLERYISEKDAVVNAQTLQVIENYELIARMESLEKEAQLQREKAEIIEKKNRAEEAAKIKQEFLSTMSHEIRTPLNAVITISSLLRDRSDSEEKELLNSLRFSANNLLRLVNDILDFTKMDAGKAALEEQPADLTALLHSIKNTYESLATEKGLNISLKVGAGVGTFYEIDETKLSQILGNLISNAIKYTDQGKIIIDISKVKQVANEDILRFSISDTGTGIAPQYHDAIFDSFYQPQSITTRKQGGSGLGLAIVKKLVELHGGTISFDSVVGKGSVFYFDLKLKRCDARYHMPSRSLSTLNGKTVLLAEDNMINAMVAMKLLSKWGIKTEHARNGLEVIEKANVQPYDFILMDLHMPEMNGLDATRHLRQNDNPNITTPIFALTADITADQQAEYVTHFNGFLRKPIEIEKLYDALSKV